MKRGAGYRPPTQAARGAAGAGGGSGESDDSKPMGFAGWAFLACIPLGVLGVLIVFILNPSSDMSTPGALLQWNLLGTVGLLLSGGAIVNGLLVWPEAGVLSEQRARRSTWSSTIRRNRALVTILTIGIIIDLVGIGWFAINAFNTVADARGGAPVTASGQCVQRTVHRTRSSATTYGWELRTDDGEKLNVQVDFGRKIGFDIDSICSPGEPVAIAYWRRTRLVTSVERAQE